MRRLKSLLMLLALGACAPNELNDRLQVAKDALFPPLVDQDLVVQQQEAAYQAEQKRIREERAKEYDKMEAQRQAKLEERYKEEQAQAAAERRWHEHLSQQSKVPWLDSSQAEQLNLHCPHSGTVIINVQGMMGVRPPGITDEAERIAVLRRYYDECSREAAWIGSPWTVPWPLTRDPA